MNCAHWRYLSGICYYIPPVIPRDGILESSGPGFPRRRCVIVSLHATLSAANDCCLAHGGIWPPSQHYDISSACQHAASWQYHDGITPHVGPPCSACGPHMVCIAALQYQHAASWRCQLAVPRWHYNPHGACLAAHVAPHCSVTISAALRMLPAGGATATSCPTGPPCNTCVPLLIL